MKYFIWLTKFIYIICGILAAFISYRIEFAILQDIIQDSDPLFAQAGAIVFEVTKICTIILYRHSDLSKETMPWLVRLITWSLRAGFIAFALFCALTFFSKYLASPNLDLVRNNEKTVVEEKYKRLKEPIEAKINKLLPIIEQERGVRFKDGSFKGNHWNQLLEENNGYETELAKLVQQESNEINIINNKSYSDYSNNNSIKNKTISDLTIVIKEATGLEIKYSGVIFFLTLLTSFLIEFSIWVTFEHIIINGFSNNRIIEERANELEEENRLWDRFTHNLSENYQRIQRTKFLQSMINRAKNYRERRTDNE